MQKNEYKKGFTLAELMMSLALSILVALAVFTVYEWSARIVTLCSKKNRSQVAAMNSSVRIMDCIRNASRVSGVDEAGCWVEFTYSDGAVAVLAYTNMSNSADSGSLGLFRVGKETVWLVSGGVTELMSDEGFDPPVFAVTNGLVYVRYRVSQPSENGERDTDDQDYAMHVRFASCLRNASD
jgi:competence protein ComGC